MDEHPDGALHYGHVGRAVYLPEAKSWTFARTLARSAAIAYTGVTKTTVPLPVNQPPSASNAARAPHQRLILNAHPDLAVCWSSIRDETFSKVVATTTEYYDPQVSSLLDLGHAVDYGNDESSSRSIPIAVAVTGECGNAVSFRMLVDDITELPREGSAVRIASIGDSETTEWSKRGAPVRQVCFARPVEEKATWMAARLAESTTVFRPLYQREPVPLHIQGDDAVASSIHLRNSRLDSNPVVEISASHTGGFPHADVTFNPWYQRQFAIVDTNGNWSVWEISGRQRRKGANWAAACVKNGSLPEAEYKPSSRHPRHDGWGSIEWIGDVWTLIVSDRRSVMLFQMADDPVRSNTVELRMARPSEWVLDVRRSSHHASHFFVLTTSRLLWFDVAAASLEEDPKPPLRPRLAWRHFRDPEDTTLFLGDLLLKDNLYLIVYSRLTELVQAFLCPFQTDEPTESAPVPDPFLLDVPAADASSQTDFPVHFSTFVFREVAHSSAPVGRLNYNPDLTLIKLFWADSRRAIHESVFTGPQGSRDDDENDIHIERNVLRLKKRHPGARKNEELDEDDFIVDDWDESAAPSTSVVSRRTAPDAPLTDLQWTLNFMSVYDMAVGNPTANADGNLETLGRPVGQLLEHLETHLAQPWDDRHTSQTVFELSGGRPLLDDIDQDAHDLKSLASAVLSRRSDAQAQYRVTILPFQFSSLFHGMPAISPEKDSELDLLEVYDRLVNEWVASLSHDMPARSRTMKAKAVRGIATDLILSRLIRISTISGDESPRAVVQANEDRPLEEPVVGQKTTADQPSSQISASQATFLAEHRPETSDDRATDGSTPLYSSLASFASFKAPRSTPRNVTNLLSHWQLGADPAAYQWQRTTQMLDEEAQRTSRATPKRRLHKKRSQTVVPDTPSVPTISVPTVRAWGSQPDSALQLPSSQPTLDVPMTQTERGLFGGREAAKKTKAKKKKRAAGF
ncbi:hypothetical protein NUU61_007617 [Penicillium alfredii]|uniref:RNA polymerase I-specific transcription initiation factor RRN6-like protein n=1 Tax=Penicillium alfredii TaxID=1506179 RepID=A0A9W9JYM4_9EURO|nr:uncharacterized protein NUU61_007617 [Penicillium alfredii]KAJ5086310.1 hypothetical protein NUU61_007617 [Penicillium alfredii]